MITDTRKSPYAKLYSVPYSDVAWTGGIYKERFDTCADVTVAHLQNMFESKDISHVLENFRIAAKETEGDFDGTVFGDGDFYKWMESAVYTAVRKNDQKLLDKVDEYIDLIGRAQQPDGYLSTKQIIGEMKSNGVSRLGDINDFEVYNFGHMFTSACLHHRLTGKDSFLNIAKKTAEYLKNLYEEAARTGEVQTAVCPSHYMGLIEMYRETGEKKYLDLARLAIELRDSVKNGSDDNQDRIPLKKHEKIVGHAVRSNYLYAGVADLYLEEGDKEYMDVLHKVWNNLVRQKIYITGGCGALYNGASPYGNFFVHQIIHQAYGYEYQLPNITAYNETCAAIGGVFWAWRMFCIEPKAEYMDMIERIMLNVNFAAISLDGKKFYYENMLRRAKKLPYELIWGQERAEYILSYCCPPNLARTIAQTSEYAYAADKDGIWTGLYGANTAHFKLENGAEFTLEQKTDYPWDGVIKFSFSNIVSDNAVKMHLRIPSWVRSGSVSAGDSSRSLSKEDAGSYIEVEVNKDKDTDVILDLGMKPRLTCAHALAEEDNNHVAVEYGPMVYCVETPDADVESLEDLLMPANAQFSVEDYEIQDRKIKALECTMLELDKTDYDRDALYQDFDFKGYKEIKVRMIPYYAWDNRGRGEMMIWLPIAYR